MIVWKATLNVNNAFFGPVSWARLTSSFHLLPRLSAIAVRGMLEDGRLPFLSIALPCAIMFRYLSSGWRALLVPFGILSLLVGFVVIFLFAQLEPVIYLENSYSRLIMLPVFGAVLYCAEAVASSGSLPSVVVTHE